MTLQKDTSWSETEWVHSAVETADPPIVVPPTAIAGSVGLRSQIGFTGVEFVDCDDRRTVSGRNGRPVQTCSLSGAHASTPDPFVEFFPQTDVGPQSPDDDTHPPQRHTDSRRHLRFSCLPLPAWVIADGGGDDSVN